jgi:hypothetical protein
MEVLLEGATKLIELKLPDVHIYTSGNGFADIIGNISPANHLEIFHFVRTLYN